MGADRIMAKVFSRKRITLKIIIALCSVLMMTGITACGFTKQTEQTEITISKDGTVSMQIIESFDKPYYDQDELRQKVLTEVASYNRNVENGNISVEKVEVEEQSAKVIMEYATAEDYARFNKSIFFVGSTTQAQEAGYDLNTVLSGTEDTMKTIGMADMLLMSDYSILITDCTEPVTINGKAAYVSSNVIVSKNKKTITLTQDTDALGYVVFQ